MKKILTKEEALSRAAALCSGSEQCGKAIMEKLLKWGIEPDTAEDIVDHLVDENYINHERYARAYVRDKFRYNHWGRIKIAQMLKMQRVEERLVRQALAEITPEEYEQAIDNALRQKFSSEKQKCSSDKRRFPEDRHKGTEEGHSLPCPDGNCFEGEADGWRSDADERRTRYEMRARLARHLVSRGFETDLVMRRIDELLDK